MYSKMQSRFLARSNGRIERKPPGPATIISPASTSRTKSAPMMSSAQLSEATIQLSPSLPRTSGRTPKRIAHRDEALGRQRGERIGALHLVQRVDHPLLDRVLEAGRDQMDDDLGVAGRLEEAAAAHQRLAQLVGIGEIAVMADRQPAEFEIREQRLDVAHRHFAGRRIAHMADRRMAFETVDHVLRAEILADMTHGAMGVELLAVEGDDAGGFLAAMLQGMKAERRQRGRFGMAENAEYAAFFMRVIVVERACVVSIGLGSVMGSVAASG